jgi:hypothetical protein
VSPVSQENKKDIASALVYMKGLESLLRTGDLELVFQNENSSMM